MLKFNTALEAIVLAYRSIPNLMEAMDGEDNAIDFFNPKRPESSSFEDTLNKMPWPSILVSHSGVVLGYRGQFTQWRHSFTVDIKLAGEALDYSDVLPLFVDGVPENGDGLTLMQCSFLDAVDSMEDVTFSRQIDNDGKAYYRMEFSLQERVG